MDMIRVENLTRKFSGLTAVDQISFVVRKGEIFGFLGPNGAGKSTTINMLSTILPPSKGQAYINGRDIISERDAVRKSIGLVFQDPSLDDRLTAEENLWFHAKLYGVPKEEYKKREKEVLELVDLWQRKDEIIRNFSGGMKRRLEIARGLIHYPSVLFLDEPTIGLDPQTRAHLWDYILKLKQEKNMTIFMTTHYMNEAEYCDRIAIIDHGKIVTVGSPVELKKAVGGDIISIKSPDVNSLKTELKKSGNYSIRDEENTLNIEVTDGAVVLPRLLRNLTSVVESVELRRPTLDDVFLKATGRAIREEEATDKDRLRERMKMRGGR